ncbi:hypothetical protein ABII15_23635 [Streptomyces sp. HUAS MG91]|uniref:Uncharacterized protein n=1 Tax=Streptomyces tabacisoli TaxID=3156398 RepID=A0AAU8IX26_9ACTN
MPSEELRKKIQYRSEAIEAEKLPLKLTDFRCFGYVQERDIPVWVGRHVSQWQQTNSEPHSRIDDDREERINRWVERFTETSGVGRRFYCRTGLEFFPWIDCEATEETWGGNLREALGSDLIFVSHNKTRIAVVFEEEYELLGFSGSALER